MFPLRSFGTYTLMNKFQWLLATYTNIDDHNLQHFFNLLLKQLLPKPYVQKLLVFYDFLDSVNKYMRRLLRQIPCCRIVWERLAIALAHARTRLIKNTRAVCCTLETLCAFHSFIFIHFLLLITLLLLQSLSNLSGYTGMLIYFFAFV